MSELAKFLVNPAVLYSVIALTFIIVIAILGMAVFALIKGGKVKAGPVEIDTENEETK